MPIWMHDGAPEASMVKSMAPGPMAGMFRSEHSSAATLVQ